MARPAFAATHLWYNGATTGGRQVVIDFALGDVLQLRKQHPCGNSTWTVVRLGADIGIVCQGCGRRILLARSELERRVKGRTPAAETER